MELSDLPERPCPRLSASLNFLHSVCLSLIEPVQLHGEAGVAILRWDEKDLCSLFRYLVPWHPKECLLSGLEAKFMPLFLFCLASVRVVFYEVPGAFFKVERGLSVLCVCNLSNSGFFAQRLLPHWCMQY